jgi:uncharacterized protein (TIGR02266 family)
MPGDDEVPKPDRPDAPQFAARIKVSFRSVDELVAAYAADLSRGELYVAAAQQLPPGTEVLLSLELPDGGPAVRVPARVTYALDADEAARQGRQPGMGTQFKETDAELAQRIAACAASSVEDDVEDDDETFSVLVVEDSPSYRSKVNAALTADGHDVETAEHGLAALVRALKEVPDVILTDVNMPVMDGWQLLRLLRSRPATKRVPVIFLTTLQSEEDRIRGYEAGVDDYIAKPFADEELALRVKRVVLRAREEKKARDRTPSTLSGDLRQVSVPSLLAFVEAERRSGLLALHAPRGEARIGLAKGRVIFVDLPDRAPTSLFERLIAVIDWTEGRFSFSVADLVPGSEAVSVQQALLEHARRKDEGV